jgi:hypothetical protein
MKTRWSRPRVSHQSFEDWAAIIIKFTWSGPRGVAGYTWVLVVVEAVMPTSPLGSCRSVAITSMESGEASKQCRQPLAPPSILGLGLLPLTELPRWGIRSDVKIPAWGSRINKL